MIRRATANDMPAIFEIRRVVFIVEQDVPEAIERDGRDDDALQFIAFESHVPIGTARVLVQNQTGKIGRVAVLESYRNQGIGSRLMRYVLDSLRDIGVTEARLASQTHAMAFYQALGFTDFGEEFLDAGIPHRNMMLPL